MEDLILFHIWMRNRVIPSMGPLCEVPIRKGGCRAISTNCSLNNKKGIEYYPWVASSKQKMQESRRSPAKCSAWQHASLPGGPTNLLSPLMSCVLTKSRKLPSPGTGDEVFFLSS